MKFTLTGNVAGDIVYAKTRGMKNRYRHRLSILIKG